MSEASAAVGTHARVRPAVTPLHRVRRIGYAVLGIQLAAFLTWSVILADRSALTWDFATYYQPWFLVAHGNLNPYSTISGIPFWQNDAEFMPWILAPLYWLMRNPAELLWLQDLSVWGAEMVVFAWICEAVRDRCGRRESALLAGLGLILLAADPWMWWTVSFDVHEEGLVILFAVLLARDMTRGRRRAWVWMVFLLLGGAPSATWIIGIGIGVMLTSRRTRATGLGMVAATICYLGLVLLVHGNAGVPLPRHFGYLATADGHFPPGLTTSGLIKGTAAHPLNVVRALWSKRVDLLANTAPGGLLGLFVPVLSPFLALVLAENLLSHGLVFARPSFQSVPLYVLMPVCTVLALIWIARRRRRTALALGGFLAAQALGWAAVWGPVTLTRWLRTPGSTAATLAGLESRIPASAEVIASQGVVGAFSGRTLVYGLAAGGAFPLHGRTWFVITPTAGVETLNPASAMSLVAELAGPLHATLVTHANGVWAFILSPAPGISQITVPDSSGVLPAWTAAGAASAAGLPVLTGQVSGWHVTATGAKGYVSDGMEWQEPSGAYRVTVALSATGPVNVEVWDDTADTLLARREIPQADGVQQVVMPITAPDASAPVYSGWGPFRADFIPPPPGQRLEVRVWSPGSETVNVYRADLTPVPGSGPAAGS